MAKQTPPTGRIKRNLAKRTSSTYSNEKDSRGGAGLPPGDTSVKDTMESVTLIRPSWDKGPCIYRAFPPLDPADPENNLLIGRENANPRAQSEWIVRVEMANYVGVGDDKVSFILGHPKEKAQIKKTPYYRFYYACKNAWEAGAFGKGMAWDASWNRLMKGKTGSGAALDKPKVMWFQQGAVYQNGDRNYMEDRSVPFGLHPDDPLVLIKVNNQVGNSLVKLLDTRKKVWEGDEEADPRGPYLYDAVGSFDADSHTIQGGRLLVAYNPVCWNPLKPTTAAAHGVKVIPTSWDGSKPKPGEIGGYEAALLRQYIYDGNIYKPDLDSDAVDQVQNKANYFFDDPETGSLGLLNPLSHEQQVVEIAKAFRQVPQLVQFGLAGEDALRLDEVKAILRARTSTVNPADVPADDEGDGEPPAKARKLKQDPTTNAATANKKGKPPVDDEDEDGDPAPVDDDEEAAGDEDEDEEAAAGDEDEEVAAGDEDEDEDEEAAAGDEDEEAAAGDEDEEVAGDEDEEAAAGDEDEEAAGDEDEEVAAAGDEDEDEDPAPPVKPAGKKPANAKDGTLFRQVPNTPPAGKTAAKPAAKPAVKPAATGGRAEMGKHMANASKANAAAKADKDKTGKEAAAARAGQRKAPAAAPPAPRSSGGTAARKK